MKFLVCAYKSQDFAQIQKKIARFHDHVTVTFRNSVYTLNTYKILSFQHYEGHVLS